MTRSTPTHGSRAVAYLRISADREGENKGVERQLHEIKELANKRGIEIVDIYRDNDVSASNGKRRPEFQRMMSELDMHAPLQAILCWAPDRLVRQPRELEDIIDILKAKKLDVLTVISGDYDLSTEDGRMGARIVGAVAKREAERISTRIKSKQRERAREGKPHAGGRRPYGYESDKVTVRESEAIIVREIATRLLANESARSIARDFNERDITTGYGGKWDVTDVRQIVERPRNAGLRAYNGGEFVKATWQPILDQATWKRVCALLNDPSRSTMMGQRGKPMKLLTGIATCGVCGSPLNAQSRQEVVNGVRQRVPAYSCRRKGVGKEGGCVSVKAERLEDLVIKATVMRLDELQAEPSEPTKMEDEAELRELDRIATERQALSDEWARGELDRKGYRRDIDALERVEAVINGRMANRVRTEAPITFLADFKAGEQSFEDLAIGKQRALIAMVIDKLTVDRTTAGRRYFDSDRVRIAYKV